MDVALVAFGSWNARTRPASVVLVLCHGAHRTDDRRGDARPAVLASVLPIIESPR